MPKFFRVALEGDTTDGRKISRQDIIDCADTFNRELYGVRVNLEHFRGLIPGGPFDMLGDVVAVKAQEDEIDVGGVKQKAMGLYAQIEPLPALAELNKAKQKIYSSVEIGQNCRGTGKAYLVGMAVTDSPASFGTQILQFASQNPDYFAGRKASAENMLVQAHEVPGEAFAADPAANPDPTGIFASIKGLLDKFTPAAPVTPEPKVEDKPADPAAAPDATVTALAAVVGQLAATTQAFIASATEAQGKLSADLAALSAKVEATPASGFTARPLATGGEGTARTDC